MVNHPNRGLPALPVLADSSHDASVLGFARTETAAMRIAKAHADNNGYDVGAVGVALQDGIEVTYDPIINTRARADRANAAGRGWVVHWDAAP